MSKQNVINYGQLALFVGPNVPTGTNFLNSSGNFTGMPLLWWNEIGVQAFGDGAGNNKLWTGSALNARVYETGYNGDNWYLLSGNFGGPHQKRVNLLDNSVSGLIKYYGEIYLPPTNTAFTKVFISDGVNQIQTITSPGFYKFNKTLYKNPTNGLYINLGNTVTTDNSVLPNVTGNSRDYILFKNCVAYLASGVDSSSKESI